MMAAYVYILSNRPNGAIYVGSRTNLIKRVSERKNKLHAGSHTANFDIGNLVYYEVCDSIEAAALREKQLKNWRRAWKVKLLNSVNPEWNDLYDEII